MHTRSSPKEKICEKQVEESGTIAALSQLVKRNGLVGVKLYWHIDDEVELETFTIEAGIKQRSGTNLTDAILRITDNMPTKICTGCKREREVSHFSRRRHSNDGLRSICNICNRQAVSGRPTISQEE